MLRPLSNFVDFQTENIIIINSISLLRMHTLKLTDSKHCNYFNSLSVNFSMTLIPVDLLCDKIYLL